MEFVMTKKNWREASIYQIYPKSFNDANGDGIGDIQGIREKIPYLKELGIDMVWLTPMQPSPQKDNGYDVSDYCAINPVYGTIEEFKVLLEELHAEGIDMMLDMVLNHTSTEHHWFQEAKKSKDNPYHDYYIWREGEPETLPNNWQSKFGGSSWAYNDATSEFYLHLFDVTQADLDWRNPKVREEIKAVLKFWADLGVDGFRLDVINLISKDDTFPDDYVGDGRRFYTDGEHVHAYLNEINTEVFTPYGILTVGEMSSTSMEACIQYTQPENKELDMTFNFHHLKVDYKDGDKWQLKDMDFSQLKTLLSDWQTGMQAGGGWNALFWCNHDQPRIVSRYGNHSVEYREKSAKMLALAMHGLQGTPYIYQGEEIGATNPKWRSIDEFMDVESTNMFEIMIKEGRTEAEAFETVCQRSRDNSRTPIPWSSADNAGFTTGKPWLKIAENYTTINVTEALERKDSVFYFYQHLIALRKAEKTLVNGLFKRQDQDDAAVFAYDRVDGKEVLRVAANFTDETVTFEWSEDIRLAETLLTNYEGEATTYQTKVQLRPYESIIWKGETLA